MLSTRQSKLLIFIHKVIIICLILILLLPGTIRGISSVEQNTGLSYWPPIIAKLEDQYTQSPNDAKITADLANAYNNYGVLLARDKQWLQAVSNVQQAININPNNQQFKKNLSNIYFEQGYQLLQTKDNYTTYTYNNVKQFAKLAIAMDPTNINAYLLLGDSAYMEQDMNEAQNAWQKAAMLAPSNNDIQKRLAQINRETAVENDMDSIFNPYFNIKIDQSISKNNDLDINKILNFAYNQVGPDFMFIQHGKIPVVVYKKEEYKEAMIDAPGWADAAYDGKIRLAISNNRNNIQQLISDVVHEYTHVIVGTLTKNNCPRWFNEGLAKYEEYKHGVPPRIYLLAIAYNTEQLLGWDKINSAIVSPNKEQALLAYQQAFSFVYYLVQEYGMNNIIAVLKKLGNKSDFSSAIQQVYGITLTNLQANWKQWLTNFITNWADEPVVNEI